jgi:hypothetical protein
MKNQFNILRNIIKQIKFETRTIRLMIKVKIHMEKIFRKTWNIKVSTVFKSDINMLIKSKKVSDNPTKMWWRQTKKFYFIISIGIKTRKFKTQKRVEFLALLNSNLYNLMVIAKKNRFKTIKIVSFSLKITFSIMK